MIEVLSGALVGGSVNNKQDSKNWGCLVAALDPSKFGDPENFIARVQQLIKRVKGAKRENGFEEILVPGERGYREAGKLITNMPRMRIVTQSYMQNLPRSCAIMFITLCPEYVVGTAF